MVCPDLISGLGLSPRMRRVNPITTPAAGPVGLINDGNTCYANAALQCILASALSKALLDPAYFDVFREINDRRNLLGFQSGNNAGPSVQSTGGTSVSNNHGPSQLRMTESRLKRLNAQSEVCQWLFVELTKLCKNYTERSEKEVWFGHNAIDPAPVTRHVKKISPMLVWGRQEDAHEFLRAAISVLVMDGHNKQLSSLFDGLLESAVTCRTCGHSSLRRDRYMDLSLEITDACVVDLCSALRAYTSTEYLGEDNMVVCEKCECKREVTKGLRLATAPTILVCQLKRFNINSYGQFVRLSKSIKFPLKLDISEYMSLANRSQPPSYELVSVLVHQGRSCNYGHYLSYVKYCGEWYRCNDAKTEKVNEFVVLAQNAYILIYEVEGIRKHKKPQASGGSVAVGRSHSFTTTSSATLQRAVSQPLRRNDSSSSKVSKTKHVSRTKPGSAGCSGGVFNFLDYDFNFCGGTENIDDCYESRNCSTESCSRQDDHSSRPLDDKSLLSLFGSSTKDTQTLDGMSISTCQERKRITHGPRSMSSNDLHSAEEHAADAHRGRSRNRTDPSSKESKKHSRASSTSRLKRLDSDSEGEATRRRRIGISPTQTHKRRARAHSQGDVSGRLKHRPPRNNFCRPHTTRHKDCARLSYGWSSFDTSLKEIS